MPSIPPISFEQLKSRVDIYYDTHARRRKIGTIEYFKKHQRWHDPKLPLPGWVLTLYVGPWAGDDTTIGAYPSWADAAGKVYYVLLQLKRSNWHFKLVKEPSEDKLRAGFKTGDHDDFYPDDTI